MKKRHAFTLIELLVVVAVIALLVSILLPSLQMAKEYAKQVVCCTRLKQIGAATRMYSEAFNGFLPDDHDVNGKRERHTYTAYRNTAGFVYPDGKLKPLRMAYLYEMEYIDIPEIFYCPGNRDGLYKYESYIKPDPWGSLPQEFNTVNGHNDWVRIGYTYYPVELKARIDSASYAPAELAVKYINLNANIPMMTDMIHKRSSISHQRNKVYKLNALYSDVHVSTCNDQTVFNDLSSPFGDDIWDRLDSGALPSMTYYDTAIYTIFLAIGP